MDGQDHKTTATSTVGSSGHPSETFLRKVQFLHSLEDDLRSVRSLLTTVQLDRAGLIHPFIRQPYSVQIELPEMEASAEAKIATKRARKARAIEKGKAPAEPVKKKRRGSERSAGAIQIEESGSRRNSDLPTSIPSPPPTPRAELQAHLFAITDIIPSFEGRLALEEPFLGADSARINRVRNKVEQRPGLHLPSAFLSSFMSVKPDLGGLFQQMPPNMKLASEAPILSQTRLDHEAIQHLSSMDLAATAMAYIGRGLNYIAQNQITSLDDRRARAKLIEGHEADQKRIEADQKTIGELQDQVRFERRDKNQINTELERAKEIISVLRAELEGAKADLNEAKSSVEAERAAAVVAFKSSEDYKGELNLTFSNAAGDIIKMIQKERPSWDVTFIKQERKRFQERNHLPAHETDLYDSSSDEEDNDEEVPDIVGQSPHRADAEEGRAGGTEQEDDGDQD